MQRFVIKFGDNDFYSTLLAFGTFILECVRYNNSDYLNKKRILQLWKETALGLYLANQNCWRYNDTPEDFERIREYLCSLTEDQIYIDDETNQFFQHDYFGNSSTLIVNVLNDDCTIV